MSEFVRPTHQKFARGDRVRILVATLWHEHVGSGDAIVYGSYSDQYSSLHHQPTYTLYIPSIGTRISWYPERDLELIQERTVESLNELDLYIWRR